MSTFLVTGTGGGTGFAAARTLLDQHHRVIATDCDPLAAGLHLPGVEPCLVPPAEDTRFIEHILKLCAQHRVDALIAGTEEEQALLARHRAEFERHDVSVWPPSPQALAICVDKLRFFTAMRAARITVPDTCAGDVQRVPFASAGYVIKPRCGRGSRGVSYATTTHEALNRARLEPDCIIQARLDGREFTADCLTSPSGETLVALRYRDRVKAGLSVAGTTFHSAKATDLVQATIAALQLQGASCVQGFINPAGVDEVAVTEVNARFAGGFRLTEAAGADLFRRYVDMLLRGHASFAGFSYRGGVTMIRYWSEHISAATTSRTGGMTVDEPVHVRTGDDNAGGGRTPGR